jgi:hypothetical protein
MAATAALLLSATASLLCLRVLRRKLLRMACSRVLRRVSSRAVRLEVAMAVAMSAVVVVAAMTTGRDRISEAAMVREATASRDVGGMEAMDSKVEMAMAMDRVVMASKVEMAMEEMEVDIPVVGMVVAVVEEVEGDIRWDGMG